MKKGKKKNNFTPSLSTKYSVKDLKKVSKLYNKELYLKLAKYNSKKKASKRVKEVETGIHNAFIGINCMIGGVDIDINKINTKKKIKSIKHYVKKSSLDYSVKRYRTSDIMFRRKFIVLATSKMLKKEKKIFNKVSNVYKNKKEYNQFRVIKDYELFGEYMNFVLDMLSDTKDKTISLFSMYNVLNNKNLNKKISKYKKIIYKMITSEYDKIYGDKSAKLLCAIFNLSLILATGKSDDIFIKKDFKNCKSEDDLSKQIKRLGKKINKLGISPMFKIYLQCNPKISTMYIKEVREDISIVSGLLSLSYFEFMMQNQTIHNVVRNLLRRPWTNEESTKKMKKVLNKGIKKYVEETGK